jgi:hypothetical protein
MRVRCSGSEPKPGAALTARRVCRGWETGLFLNRYRIPLLERRE